MEEFNKENLEFHLPDKFKGLGKKYMMVCILEPTIQDNWIPKVGDLMVTSTGNIFPISNKHDLVEDLGGPIFMFSGHLCSRDGGAILHSTHCSLMNRTGYTPEYFDEKALPMSHFRYIPYPHEIDADLYDHIRIAMLNYEFGP